MSWNWKDREEYENKEYEVHGTVTISTEEYRDLITQAEKLYAAGQKEHDDWYEERRRAEKAEDSLKKAEASLAELTEWLDSDESLRPKFKLWKVEKMEATENKED